MAEFTSYIGGLLSMWLGFSLFGFYGLAEKSVVRILNHFLEKRNMKRKQTTPTIGQLSGINQLMERQNTQTALKSSKVQDMPYQNNRHTPIIRKIQDWQSIYSGEQKQWPLASS